MIKLALTLETIPDLHPGDLYSKLWDHLQKCKEVTLLTKKDRAIVKSGV